MCGACSAYFDLRVVACVACFDLRVDLQALCMLESANVHTMHAFICMSAGGACCDLHTFVHAAHELQLY